MMTSNERTLFGTKFMTRWFLVGAIAFSPVVTGCFISVDETDDEDEDTPSTVEHMGQHCVDRGAFDPNRGDVCFREGNSWWHPNCEQGECARVPVSVVYMLTEDLGHQHTVAVEAFDNPKFLGHPVSSVRMANFPASRPLDSGETEIYLGSGDYYLRAFITRQDEATIPYSYQDMELVGGETLGIYRALSGPEMVRIGGDPAYERHDQVRIQLNKLYAIPGEEEPTEAFLRIRFHVESTDALPKERNVIIQLLEDEDIYRKPAYEFAMGTSELMVNGRLGKATFLSPELVAADYVVFAFIDEDGNQLYDEGEWAQISGRNGKVRYVTIEEERTATVSLSLDSDFEEL